MSCGVNVPGSSAILTLHYWAVPPMSTTFGALHRLLVALPEAGV